MRRRHTLRRVAVPFGQILLAIVILLPFFWMLSVSLKPPTEPFAIPARLWPAHPTLANYGAVLRPAFERYFLNSIVVCAATLAITVPLALLAAYAFTRFQLRVLRIVMIAVILAQLFPSSAIIIPIYRMVKAADLLNTYAALIIAYITITLPVAIWMLQGFLANIPAALEEAAAVDGATRLRAFFAVVVPLCRPGLVASSVFILIVTWQEFLFALSFTSTKEMATLPVGMNDYIGQFGIHYGALMASSVLVSLPVVLAFFLVQRQFVAGLTAGSVKG
ncbi:MAG: carbohydrate ABC transporter permease [Acetobacteraceae bacterium]